MSDLVRPLSCIVCLFQPESVLANTEFSNQPYAATAFYTHGHYGSTFFDPMSDRTLEIVVCDECLRKAEKRKQILLVTPDHTYVPPKYEVFDSERHDV